MMPDIILHPTLDFLLVSQSAGRSVSHSYSESDGHTELKSWWKWSPAFFVQLLILPLLSSWSFFLQKASCPTIAISFLALLF